MKVDLQNPSKDKYILSAKIEGDDNEQMHEDFAKCIALFRGLDDKIVVRSVDIVDKRNSVLVNFTCPYDFTYVKDGLNKHFTQHGFGIK